MAQHPTRGPPGSLRGGPNGGSVPFSQQTIDQQNLEMRIATEREQRQQRQFGHNNGAARYANGVAGHTNSRRAYYNNPSWRSRHHAVRANGPAMIPLPSTYSSVYGSQPPSVPSPAPQPRPSIPTMQGPDPRAKTFVPQDPAPVTQGQHSRDALLNRIGSWNVPLPSSGPSPDPVIPSSFLDSPGSHWESSSTRGQILTPPSSNPSPKPQDDEAPTASGPVSQSPSLGGGGPPQADPYAAPEMVLESSNESSLPPTGTPIDTTMTHGDGPMVQYRVLHLQHASPSGTHYLFANISDGFLWYGVYDGPYAYLKSYAKSGTPYETDRWEVGNKKMLPVAAGDLFPLLQKGMRLHNPDHGQAMRTRRKIPNIFGRGQCERKDACARRLANEIAICERIQPPGEGRLYLSHHPNLALYCGIIVHEIGSPRQLRATQIVYRKYSANLWEFCRKFKFLVLQEQVDEIVAAIKSALKYLHDKFIVHGQVKADHIYLQYRLKIEEVRDPGDGKHSRGRSAPCCRDGGKGKPPACDAKHKPVAKFERVLLGGFDPEYKLVAEFDHIVLGDFDVAEEFFENKSLMTKIKEYYAGCDRDNKMLELLREWMEAVLHNPNQQFNEAQEDLLQEIEEGNLDYQEMQNVTNEAGSLRMDSQSEDTKDGEHSPEETEDESVGPEENQSAQCRAESQLNPSTNDDNANESSPPPRRELPSVGTFNYLPPGAAPGGGVSLTSVFDRDGEPKFGPEQEPSAKKGKR